MFIFFNKLRNVEINTST